MTDAPRITGSQLAAMERQLCMKSFKDFVRCAWSHADPAPFRPNWHIGVICDHLQAVAEGEITRLVINVPPGMAKSILVGVMFPAWVWARGLDTYFGAHSRIISAANILERAKRDSRKCRNLISSPWYQRHWGIQLSSDENSKTRFENAHKGAREAMAFDNMTGSRGNIVLIDDPHTVASAKSRAQRRTTVENFLEAVPNRINDPERDAIIVIMQRLHEDDVVGAILDRPELEYEHLCIPMIAEDPREPTAIGWSDHREPGELLFPEFLSAKTVSKLQASLGPFAFAGQYQQRPAPATDGFFSRDWFNRYKPEELPKALNYYMTSDHAPGGLKTSDYNVFRMWGVDEKKNVYLVDSFRKQCLMDEALGIDRGIDGRIKLRDVGALPLIKKWNPRGWYPENDGTWTTMQSFVDSAMRETAILCRIKPLALKGAGDKEGKASAYQALASMGMVFLPSGEVGDIALDEYQQFPVGKNDDQVDADGAIARVIADVMPAFIPKPEAVKKRRRLFDDTEVETSSDAFW